VDDNQEVKKGEMLANNDSSLNRPITANSFFRWQSKMSLWPRLNSVERTCQTPISDMQTSLSDEARSCFGQLRIQSGE
jgi:hypothetical protein